MPILANDTRRRSLWRQSTENRGEDQDHDQKPAPRRGASRGWLAAFGGVLAGIVVGGVLATVIATRHGDSAAWFAAWTASDRGDGVEGSGALEARGHDDHDDQDDHDDVSIELSRQARANIGLALTTVSVGDFVRAISVPGVVVERPGRTLVTVSAPLAGVVEAVVPLQGEAVGEKSPLFELRLTDQDLVDRQSELLLAIEELDVVGREIGRLKEVTATGAVAGRTLLDRQYQRRNIEAAIRAHRQALILHGLTDEHIDHIAENRKLLAKLDIFSPSFAPNGSGEHVFQMVDIMVRPGDHVEVGRPLAALADYSQLQVEGKAFERDAATLHRAVKNQAKISVFVEGDGHGTEEVGSLGIVYVENSIARESRALKFFVGLPNEVVRDHRDSNDRRFLAWRFKPGQRVEVSLPVERWTDRIVLPVQAVVQEGAESFVFEEIDGRFVRREVEVEYRDQRSAVLANDGDLTPGKVVVAKGAYQIQLAMKQKAGDGAHADHHHH
ncbi:MAG: secretion protein HlyD [Pirellulaceae bacterium]|nr:secretion protein HlyD [Pirellulaceae bacterium]